MADEVPFTAPSDPNYHIFLWTEPPGMPPTYLCLLCAFADATEAEVQAHVTEVHALTPVPTPMAASPPLLEEATGLLAVPNQEGRDDG